MQPPTIKITVIARDIRFINFDKLPKSQAVMSQDRSTCKVRLAYAVYETIKVCP